METGFICEHIQCPAVSVRNGFHDGLKAHINEPADSPLVHDIDIFPERADVVGAVGSFICIFHTEYIQNLFGFQVAFQFRFRKRHRNHPVELNIAFVNPGGFYRIFCGPDDFIRFVIQTETRVGGFISDPAVHIKAFGSIFRMTFQCKPAALTAGISHFVINPIGKSRFIHGVQNFCESADIFGIGCKPVGEGNIGNSTAVTKLVQRFHGQLQIRWPSVHHGIDSVFLGWIFKQTAIYHGKPPDRNDFWGMTNRLRR